MTRAELVAGILARCEPHCVSDCILWTGHENPHGYGRCWFPLDRDEPHHAYAHRVLYTLIRGPIPDGFALHHICHVKLCVNAYHLEPIGWSEHALYPPAPEANEPF